MEAVPRLPMLSFDLKTSDHYDGFGPKLKQYIRNNYNEDPELFANEINQLEGLRAAAVRPVVDVTGCATLKKYFCQLHFLASRFPMGKDDEAAVRFTWSDLFANMSCSVTDISFEIVSVLYNIGALHSQLGAADNRTSADGMKMSCTHFQCAAWAFQHLREEYPQAMGLDVAPDFMSFLYQVCLAQAQECILEKSMMDNRKATIISKVAVQAVDYYKQAVKLLTQSSDENGFAETIGSKTQKKWEKYLKFKMTFYGSVVLLYQGQQAEEAQKMGERVAFYQAAFDKLEEAKKLGKGLDNKDAVNETLTFTQDVVEGKRKAAKNENEFIYHEVVPNIQLLPEMKGASLVKGIPFNINDPEVSGPDIFARIVPMKAHESSSLYSEEKAKLLRKISEKVESKSEELDSFLATLELDNLYLNLEASRLPQELVDRCAALSAKPDAIQNLIEAMNKLSDIYHDVEAMIREIQELLAEEDMHEKDYQQVVGKRPPSIAATDLTREAKKYQEAHAKASESNQTLHKAMVLHIANLRSLSQPPKQLEAQIPGIIIESPEDEANLKEMQHLMNKVDEMKRQRLMLIGQLRDAICQDDITRQVVTYTGESLSALFEQELNKHQKYVSLIEQNLAAQENILRAVKEAYARYASTRRVTAEMARRRETAIASLVASYDAYEDLILKSTKGLDFYHKLENNVSKLLTRVKGTCKVQEEEREQILARNIKTPKDSYCPDVAPSSGLKLKDYLNMKKETGTLSTYHNTNQAVPPTSTQQYGPGLGAQAWVPGVRPAPVGSEETDPVLAMEPSWSKDSSTKLENGKPYYPSSAGYYPGEQFSANYQGYTGYAQQGYSRQSSGTSVSSYDTAFQAGPQQSYQSAAMSHYYPSATSQPYPSPTQQPYETNTSQPYHTQSSQPYQSGSSQPYYSTSQTYDSHPSHNTSGMSHSHTTHFGYPGSTDTTNTGAGYPGTQATYNAATTVAGAGYPGTQTTYNAATTVAGAGYPGTQTTYNAATTVAGAGYPGTQTTYNAATTVAGAGYPGTQATYTTTVSGLGYQSPYNIGGTVYSSTQATPATGSNYQANSSNVAGYQTSYNSSTTGAAADYQNNTAATAGYQNNTAATAGYHNNTAAMAGYQATTGATAGYQNNAGATSSYQPPPSANYQVATGASGYPSSYDTGYPAAYNQATPTVGATPGYQTAYNTVPAAADYRVTPNTSVSAIDGAHPSPTHKPDMQGGVNAYMGHMLPTATVAPTQYSSTADAMSTSNVRYTYPAASDHSTGGQPSADAAYQAYISQAAPSTTTPYQGYPQPAVAAPQQEGQPSTEAAYPGYTPTAYPNYSQAGMAPANMGGGQTWSQGYDDAQPRQDYMQTGNMSLYTACQNMNYSSTSSNCQTAPGSQLQGQEQVYYSAQYGSQTNQPTYMQAGPENQQAVTNTTFTNKTSPTAKLSNIDLLAGLDFEVEHSPLVPEAATKKEADVVRPSKLDTKPAPVVFKEEPSVRKDEPSGPKDEPSGRMEEPMAKVSPVKDGLSDLDNLNQFVQEVEKFEKFVEGLSQKTLNGPTCLDVKWKELTEVQEKESLQHSISVARCYPMKNRFADILPYDDSRVELPSTKDDYINASRLKELSAHLPQLILTQAPLPSTYTDFWAMVMEHQVEVVVCLLSDAELGGHVYWPKDRSEEMEVGRLRVALQSCTPRQHWVERILSLSSLDTRVTRVVVHLQLTAWPGSLFPTSPAFFLSFVSEARTFLQQQRSSAHPAVVHCLSGVGRTGLFCLVLSSLIEVSSGTLPDLVGIASRISRARKNCLRDREHLKFAYHSVLYYCQDLLMKRGILTSCSSFEDRKHKEGTAKGHTRHPSQDFLLGPDAGQVPVSDMEQLVITQPTRSQSACSRRSSAASSGRSSPHSLPSNLPVNPLESLTSLDAASLSRHAQAAQSKKKFAPEAFTQPPGLETFDASSVDPLARLDPLWTIKK